MKKITSLLVLLSLMGFAVSVFAQSDLEVFPIGTTTMRYTVSSEDTSEPQILELVVTSYGDDRYTVRMVTEQTGNEDELATGFGFIFGSAMVASGGGHDADFSSLSALMNQPDRLQEGQDMMLGASADFTNIVSVEIAGVWCFVGTIIDRDEPDVRMTVAVALTNPVYISPLIRAEELRDGEWVETFSLELVEYTVVEGEG
jgi:hypothetical protein